MKESFCEVANSRKFRSATEAISSHQQPGSVSQPAVWKCEACGYWHVAVQAKAIEVTPGPTLDTRSAGAMVGTKVV